MLGYTVHRLSIFQRKTQRPVNSLMLGEGRGGDSLSLCSSGAKATERLTVIRACFPGTNFSKGG